MSLIVMLILMIFVGGMFGFAYTKRTRTSKVRSSSEGC